LFSNPKYKKIGYPLVTSLLFSGSFVAAKYTTFDLKPLTTTFFRYFVALLFLTILIKFNKPSGLKIQRKDIILFILLGLSGIVGYHYFFFLSLHFTEVANTAIINAMNPIVTGIAAAIFIKEKLFKKNYIGIILSFVGVIILLTKGRLENLIGFNFNKGDLLMLISGLNWVVYTLLIKKMIKKYSGFTLTYYATLFGVVFLIFLTLTEGLFEQIKNISLPSILSIIYMGVGASGLGYLLYNYSIKEIGPTKTSSFVYSCVPIFVAILAYIFFDQTISLVMAVSVIFILFGLRFMLKEK